MKILSTLVFFAASLGLGRAAVLDTLPSPMMQDEGMVHIDVIFLDQPADTFSSSLEFGGAVVPDLKPLSLWSPGNTINPTKAYYDEIDPTQEAMLFGSRWGFRVDTDNSNMLPVGSSIGIRMTSATTNLGAYFYNSVGAGIFQPLFLTAAAPRDFVLWDGLMWHPVFTMPATTAFGTPVSATFEFFLADAAAVGSVDWTTSASPVAGYSLGSQTITWTAIPEPGSAGLLVAAAGAWLLLRRRVNRGQ